MSLSNHGFRRSQARRRRGSGRGFTLVELLVVVGVITLLIALLMPLLSGAREQAGRVACMANLRTLTGAWLQYADGHRGRLCGAVPRPVGSPGFCDWVAAGPDEQSLRDGVLWPFVNAAGAYRCPADEVNSSHTYLINSWLNGEGPPAPGDSAPAQTLSRLRNASETFVFLEHLDRGGCNDRSFKVPPYPSEDWIDLPALGLHGRAGLISFADGHVIVWNWLTPAEWHRNEPEPLNGRSKIDADLRQAQRWIGHGPYPAPEGH